MKPILALFAALIATPGGPATARDLGWNWAWQAHEAAEGRHFEQQQEEWRRQSERQQDRPVYSHSGGNTRKTIDPRQHRRSSR
jgi:hypothetical protein